MPRNGSGVYTAPNNSWNPAVNGAQALPADWMAILQDLVAAMTQSTSADGQTAITGVWNFGNNRITGVGAPVGTGNALRWEQMIKGQDIASAATISIPIEGSLFDVTGTTTITTIDDVFPGRVVFLRFLDAVTIENSAGLKTPTGRNETTISGDVLCLINTNPGVWEVVYWPRLIATDFRGATPPSVTWPYMPWLDEGEDTPVLRRRNKDNDGWGDDVARIKAAPAEESGDVVTFEQVPGIGQAWQDVTSSRSAGVTYLNATGKLIQVAITINAVTTATAALYSDAIMLANPRLVASDGRIFLYAGIPAGGSYILTLPSGSINNWAELR